MKTLIQAIKTFWNDDDGMEMIEYALFGALIVVAAATAFTSFGTTIGLQIKK